MVRFIDPSEDSHSQHIFGFSSERKEGALQKIFNSIQTKRKNEEKAERSHKTERRASTEKFLQRSRASDRKTRESQNRFGLG